MSDTLIDRYLDLITKAIEIMTLQTDAAVQVQAITTLLGLVKDKITALVIEIATLKDLAASSAQNITPALQAAIDASTAQATEVKTLMDSIP